jgi:hypothetical protein
VPAAPAPARAHGYRLTDRYARLISMDGDQWLTTVFAPCLRRESLAFGSDADLLRGQLRALRDCEVLDEAEYAAAEHRIDAAVEAARERAGFRVRPAGYTQPPPRLTATLHRVLAVARPVAEVDGMPIALTSVELWSDRSFLHLAGLPTEAADEHVRQVEAHMAEWGRRHQERRSGDGSLSPPELRGGRLLSTLQIVLRDDHGTTYHWTGGHSGGSQTEWRMQAHYAPGVPDDATRLILEIGARDEEPVSVVQLPL